MKLTLLLVATSLLVETCGDADVQSILNSVYEVEDKEHMVREKQFIHKLWPEITKKLPKWVFIPKFQENVGLYNYLCAHETVVTVHVGEILRDINFEADQCGLNKNCIVASIEAQLHIMEPVTFEIYKREPAATPGAKPDSFVLKNGAINKVQFLFGQANIIKFWLRIPDLSKNRNNIQTNCYVHIDSVELETLSDPEFDKTNEIGGQFWNSVKDDDIYSMLNIGVMKTMLDLFMPSVSKRIKSVFAAETELFCLSTEFPSSIMQGLNDYSEDKGGVKNDDSASGKKTGITMGKDGKLTYEKFNTAQYISFIQFGIAHSVIYGVLKPTVNDFDYIAKGTIVLSSTGEQFYFITYAPGAFRKLRDMFDFTEYDYTKTVCDDPLKELSNPGKSGSGLYLSHNKYFITKTIQRVEANFIQTFFQGYVSNLQQNPNTILPKLFGLYEYKVNNLLFSNSIRLLVMNNLMPPDARIDQKYDLKGSTFEREASEKEKAKASTTYKDNDFTKHHPYGIFLNGDDYDMLVEIIQSDCKVLRSFQIIDYSLLLGLHYKDRTLSKSESDKPGEFVTEIPCEPDDDRSGSAAARLLRRRNLRRGEMPALTARGDKLVLHFGIIDMLQTYGTKKKLENFWKSKILNDNGISVVEPNFYASRFEDFMKNSVFKRMIRCPPGKSAIKVIKK